MIIAIVGPTGAGKTKMSIELAKKFDGEIISADSAQVYRELNIGTAKIKEEEMEGIKHYFINIRDVNESYSIYDYQKDARATILDIQNRGKTVIVVGGSGLYLSALFYDYKFSKNDNVYDFDSLSNDEMYEVLKGLNLDLKLDRKNRQRLIRYYAKYINNSEEIVASDGDKLLYDVKFIGLTTDREVLYKLIDYRVDKMIEDGLIKEVRDLYTKYPNEKELKTIIGYKEFAEYIVGNIGLETVIESIKQNSRNYAKRQYTWFNHKLVVKWFDTNYANFGKTVKEVIDYLDK